MTQDQASYYINLLISFSAVYVTAFLASKAHLLPDDLTLPFNRIHIADDIERKNNEINLNEINDKELEEYVNVFCKRLIENTKEEDLTIFYNNINSFKILFKDLKIDNYLFKKTTKANYNCNNTITINKDTDKTVIFHELFHLASTYMINGVFYSGFSQQALDVSIGNGLNEGYTQLLSERYFDDYNPIKSYGYLVNIAKKVEQIIGEGKMKSLYYNISLTGLIDEFKKYAEVGEIIVFIKNLDYVCSLYKKLSKIDLKIINKYICEKYKEINDFLIKAYMVKKNLQFNENIISEDECNNDISSFVKSLPIRVHHRGGDYSFYENGIDDEKYNEIKDYIEYKNYVLKLH